VHRWRAEADAVAVGIGTALADDPLLTARDVDAAAPRQPARVVFDSAARLPLESKLVRSIDEAPLYVVAAVGAPVERVTALTNAGADVIEVAGDRTRLVGAALDELGRREIGSLLLEGGSELAGSFLDSGEVDELRLFIAPLILGAGRPLAGRRGVAVIAEAERPLATEWQRCGEDMLVRARLREW
jgi:diaminohydroxyphosphoribosylaminopyrimidine deaminase/5-amino-6-(5-phosphoribosylamino)uracil reductase